MSKTSAKDRKRGHSKEGRSNKGWFAPESRVQAETAEAHEIDLERLGATPAENPVTTSRSENTEKPARSEGADDESYTVHRDWPPPHGKWPFGEPVAGARAKGGRSKYLNPITGVKHPSVTGILGLINKPALTAFAVKQVAEEAVTAPYDPESESSEDAIARLKRAQWKGTSKGTEAHKAMADNVFPDRCEDPEMKGLLKAGYTALNTLGLRPAAHEVRVWGDGFAGQVDMVAIDENGDTVAVEFKTTSKEEPVIYNDSILQASAYANGDVIANEEGEVFEVPGGIKRAAVISISPSGKWRSVQLSKEDMDEAFKAFRRWKKMGEYHEEWEKKDFNSGDGAQTG